MNTDGSQTDFLSLGKGDVRHVIILVMQAGLQYRSCFL